MTKKLVKKYSIEGIAKEVGYKSAYAFSRAFKKHIKITPSEFIKNLKNKRTNIYWLFYFFRFLINSSLNFA